MKLGRWVVISLVLVATSIIVRNYLIEQRLNKSYQEFEEVLKKSNMLEMQYRNGRRQRTLERLREQDLLKFDTEEARETEISLPTSKPFGVFTPMPSASPYLEIVLSFSKRYDLDPALVLAVMKNESNFRPEVVSNKGAVGLMQVLPSTASWILDMETTAEDLKNPSINIQAGMAYLSFLQKRVQKFPKHKQVELIFAGYNAGHGRILKGKVPNFKETKNYVVKCIKTRAELIG